MNTKKWITISLLIFFSLAVPAQDTAFVKPSITWSVYADVYYGYDFNRPANHEKPFFIYNHKRNDEVNLNLGLVQAVYQGEKIRSTIGLQVGNYPEYNYAAEPDLLRHVFQANVGVKLSRNGRLWLDAGILPSHIGYESAISKDNWTLTRSLAAENSPYYEAGAKLTYTSGDNRWLLSGSFLNGWQRIRRINGNRTPAFGTQLTFRPGNNASFNWSTFVGNDYPDNIRRWRYFNNFYALLQPTEKFGIGLGVDVGLEQKRKGVSSLNAWYTPNLVMRFSPCETWAFGVRGEYFQDKNGVIVTTGSANGFQIIGGSLNADKKISDNLWWRTEVRTLNSRDAIFSREGEAVTDNIFVTTSVAVAF